MTYKHLTTRELTLIADFWYQGTKAYRAAKLLQRSQETIYRVYRFLNNGKTIDQYLQTYQRHKRRCGRKQIQLPTIEVNYIHAQIKAGWTPDTIIGLLILLLVVMNTQLAAVCAPFIACLPAISMAFPLNSYR